MKYKNVDVCSTGQWRRWVCGRRGEGGGCGGGGGGGLFMNSRQWMMEALPGVQAPSTAAGTREHASLPCPLRCQFGWAPFRMGALFSRIHGGSQGSVSRQWLLRSGAGWNLNQGQEREKTKCTYSPLFLHINTTLRENEWGEENGSLCRDCTHLLKNTMTGFYESLIIMLLYLS